VASGITAERLDCHPGRLILDQVRVDYETVVLGRVDVLHLSDHVGRCWAIVAGLRNPISRLARMHSGFNEMIGYSIAGRGPRADGQSRW